MAAEKALGGSTFEMTAIAANKDATTNDAAAAAARRRRYGVDDAGANDVAATRRRFSLLESSSSSSSAAAAFLRRFERQHPEEGFYVDLDSVTALKDDLFHERVFQLKFVYEIVGFDEFPHFFDRVEPV